MLKFFTTRVFNRFDAFVITTVTILVMNDLAWIPFFIFIFGIFLSAVLEKIAENHKGADR